MLKGGGRGGAYFGFTLLKCIISSEVITFIMRLVIYCVALLRFTDLSIALQIFEINKNLAVILQ